MTDLRKVSGGHCCKLRVERLRGAGGLGEAGGWVGWGGNVVAIVYRATKYSFELFNSVTHPTLPLFFLISSDNSPLKYIRPLPQEDPTALPKSLLIAY